MNQIMLSGVHRPLGRLSTRRDFLGISSGGDRVCKERSGPPKVVENRLSVASFVVNQKVPLLTYMNQTYDDARCPKHRQDS
jgi:hypothetical protein